jgi:hypothetical protein
MHQPGRKILSCVTYVIKRTLTEYRLRKERQVLLLISIYPSDKHFLRLSAVYFSLVWVEQEAFLYLTCGMSFG